MKSTGGFNPLLRSPRGCKESETTEPLSAAGAVHTHTNLSPGEDTQQYFLRNVKWPLHLGVWNYLQEFLQLFCA